MRNETDKTKFLDNIKKITRHVLDTKIVEQTDHTLENNMEEFYFDTPEKDEKDDSILSSLDENENENEQLYILYEMILKKYMSLYRKKFYEKNTFHLFDDQNGFFVEKDKYLLVSDTNESFLNNIQSYSRLRIFLFLLTACWNIIDVSWNEDYKRFVLKTTFNVAYFLFYNRYIFDVIRETLETKNVTSKFNQISIKLLYCLLTDQFSWRYA